MNKISKVTDIDYLQKATITNNNNSSYNGISNELNRLSDQLKESSKKLTETNRLLHDTQEITHLGIWEFDLELNVLTWSDQVYKIFEVEKGETASIYEIFNECIHPDDRNKVDTAYSNSLKNEHESYEIEHRIICKKSGEIKFVKERCKHEKNAFGKIIKSIGFVQDITASKKAEDLYLANLSNLNELSYLKYAMRANSLVKDLDNDNKTDDNFWESLNELTYYKYAIDKASIVAITNQKGIINYVNDNFCELSKYKREELIGQDHRIVNSGFHSKEFISDIWKTIANGEIWKGEIKNLAKDGTYYWVDTTIVPILNEHGKPNQYLSIRNDITSRKKAEEQLLLSKNSLEQKVIERTAKLSQVISNLKISKKLLKESEAFSVGILNALSSHVAVIDQFGNIIAVNDAWKNFAVSNYDSSLKQAGVGENYFDVCKKLVEMGDLIAEKTLNGIKDVIAKKRDTFSLEYPCFSDNSKKWFNMNVINFEYGKPMVVISHIDITERKLSEEKTRVSEQRYLSLFEQASDAIMLTDLNGNFVDTNESACNMLGYSKEELVGTNMRYLIDQKELEERPVQFNEEKEGKHVFIERTFVHKNGTIIEVEANVKKIDNDLLLAIVRDITERNKIDKDLLQSIERYNLVAQATNDSVWELDVLTGKLNRTGDGFEILFGYEKERINNDELNYTNLIHPDDVKGLRESETLVFDNPNENNWEHDYRFLKANGEYAYVHDKGFVIRDENGKAIRMIGATQDITERVKYINAIEEQNKKLKEIAWVQSHIVRAPLSRMMGIVNLINEVELNSKEFKDWVKHFVASGAELDSIIRDISSKTDEIELTKK